ncbi:MAG: TonB-dependent receptor [Flavihumibacter sp.]
MRKFYMLMTAFLVTVTAFAQQPAGGAPGGSSGGGFPGGGAGMPIGHVFGKITDDNGKGLEDASVILLQSKFDTVAKKPKEVLFKALVTRGKGEFSFESVPAAGKFTLKISMVGFAPQEIPVMLSPQAAEKDLGNIKMKTDATQLQDVTVVASKPGMTLDIDKKTFNVDKNLVSAGGTGLDVLRNVPSIQVDIDGNIKLRNATPQLYIDGRPTTLTIDQIPADAIETVEVITNPSAKYDASGGNAGILNIVLKKNKKSGYNGSVNAAVDRFGGWNLGGNINLRQEKFNVSASLMSNNMRNRGVGNTERYNTGGDVPVSIFQNGTNRNKGGFLFGRIGLDYFVSNRTTLSASVTRVHGEFKPTDNISFTTDSLYPSGTVSSYSGRVSNTNREFNGLGLQAGMKHNFKKTGEEWTIDINSFGGKNDGDALYTTSYFTKTGTVGATQEQRNISDGRNRFTTIQTDYVNPISSKLKIETGLRAQISTTQSNNDNTIKYPGSDVFVPLPGATANYKNTNDVFAAYISASGKLTETFSYNIGLRGESSRYNGTLENTNQKFSNDYPISLFPSLFLSKKLKNDQELQLSITRRINRPNFFQLIPYTDYTDSLNITRGNPNLVPEFTTSAEVSYSKKFAGNNTLLLSGYYKYTDNLITRYVDTATNEISGKPDYLTTYVNANSSIAYGLEITSMNTLTKWWDMTTNINLYNSRINTDNLKTASQDPMWSMFAKWNNNFKLPAKFAAQLSLNYQSKTNLPVTSGQQFGPPMQQAQSSSQGYIRPFYAVDLALKRSFLKDNALTATLSVNDIFRSRRSDQYTEGTGFYQNYYRLNNPQLVRLGISYRFGKLDMNLFKRQNNKDNSSDGMQMMQQ